MTGDDELTQEKGDNQTCVRNSNVARYSKYEYTRGFSCIKLQEGHLYIQSRGTSGDSHGRIVVGANFRTGASLKIWEERDIRL